MEHYTGFNLCPGLFMALSTTIPCFLSTFKFVREFFFYLIFSLIFSEFLDLQTENSLFHTVSESMSGYPGRYTGPGAAAGGALVIL